MPFCIRYNSYKNRIVDYIFIFYNRVLVLISLIR